MDAAAIEARRAYKREWNRKNPEKVKAATERYWQKRAREAQEAQQALQTQGKPPAPQAEGMSKDTDDNE